MALDPEEELRSIWLQWLKDANSINTSEDSQRYDQFYVDERNQPDVSGKGGRNSVMDAEALLCFLQPQGSVDPFNIRSGFGVTGIGVDDINQVFRPSADPGSSLDEDAIEIVIALSTDYLERNRHNGISVFEAGTYLEPTTACSAELRARSLDIVDSYTLSVSVCLHLLYLLGPSGWGNESHTNKKVSERCLKACDLANERLTSALQGLCQSFAYSEMTEGKWEQATMITWPKNDQAIMQIRQRLRRLEIETNENQAFECGWSWGLHPDAREVLGKAPPRPDDALASPNPYLYFTLNAIDGVADLFEEWVQTEELLSADQLALAARLRNLSDLTSQYWAAIAFSESKAQKGKWALEAIPWRTADGSASIQWSLYVYGLALRDHLARRRANTPSELTRLISLLEELAERGRLTRIPVDNSVPKAVSEQLQTAEGTAENLLVQAQRDPALTLHWPGLELTLGDIQDRPIYVMPIYDFAPQLLKRAAILLGNTSELDLRDRLRTLIDAVWDEHLKHRSNTDNRATEKYWDFPDNAYSAFETYGGAAILIGDKIEGTRKTTKRVASWYVTQRVTEAMVALSHATGKRQRGRLTTFESFLKELSDHLINDIDILIARSGPTDRRERLEPLRTRANAVRNQFDQGDLTLCLRSLIDLVRETKEF